MKKIVKHRLFWPIVALLALVAVNTISRPSFLRITVQDGQFYGSIIDILRNSAPLMLVALGMTIVIATRGIDLSVGALMAVSGAVALTIIQASPEPDNLGVVLLAIGAGVLTTLILGVWNGFLVAALGIQPIIATLVLMLAGRGIALLITGGFITTINSTPYQFIAQGSLLGLPFAFYVSIVAIVIVGLVERRTALGVGQFLVAAEGQFKMAKDTRRTSSTSRGKSGSSAFLKMYLPSPPRSFRRCGRPMPHSTKR